MDGGLSSTHLDLGGNINNHTLIILRTLLNTLRIADMLYSTSPSSYGRFMWPCSRALSPPKTNRSLALHLILKVRLFVFCARSTNVLCVCVVAHQEHINYICIYAKVRWCSQVMDRYSLGDIKDKRHVVPDHYTISLNPFIYICFGCMLCGRRRRHSTRTTNDNSLFMLWSLTTHVLLMLSFWQFVLFTRKWA